MTTATRDIFRNLWALRRRVEALGGEYSDDEGAQRTADVVREIQRAHPEIARAVSKCFAMRRATVQPCGVNLSRWLFAR
jgi:hypothetical protein